MLYCLVPTSAKSLTLAPKLTRHKKEGILTHLCTRKTLSKPMSRPGTHHQKDPASILTFLTLFSIILNVSSKLD